MIFLKTYHSPGRGVIKPRVCIPWDSFDLGIPGCWDGYFQNPNWRDHKAECLQGHTPSLSSMYSLTHCRLVALLAFGWDWWHFSWNCLFCGFSSFLVILHLTLSFYSPWKADSAFLWKLAFLKGLSSVLFSLHVDCSPYQTFPLPMLSITPNPQISSQRSRLRRPLPVISQSFLLVVPQAHLILHSEVNSPSFFLICSFSLLLVWWVTPLSS